MLPDHNSPSQQREGLDPKKLMIDFKPGFSSRDALNVLFCHKWKIILFFCTVVSAISVSTYRMPYFYSSEAKILIGVGRDPNTIAPILGPSQYLNQNQQERVNNEVLILKSRFLAERVVDKIGYEHFFKKRKAVDKKTPDKTPTPQKAENQEKTNTSETPNKDSPSSEPPKPEKSKVDKELWNIAVNQVFAGLAVELKPLSFIIGLTVTLRDPYLAEKVLKTLIEVYINRYLELSEAKAEDVFQKRYEKFAEELRKKEEALSQFKVENNIFSLDDQKSILISRAGELVGQISTNEAKLLSLKSKIEDLTKLLPKYSKVIISQKATGKTNYVSDALKNLLFKLQNQEIEMASRYPSDSRKVTEIKEQIVLIEQHLANEPESKEELTESLNQNYEHFSKELEESKIEYNSQEKSLAVSKEQLKKYKEELDKLTSYELTLSRLEREQDIAHKEYIAQLNILQKAENYKALNESKIVSVDIIEPPTFSEEAVKPDKPKNIVLGIILGLLGGIGLAFFLDYFDDSMKTNEDVKRHLKLPVLAMITTDEFERLSKY